MHKYGIIIYWSDEDQLYIAEAPELPGCMTHGDTQDAALANAREAIQLWINAAKEFGNPVPKPKGRRLTLDSVKSKGSQPERKQPPTASPRRKNQTRLYYDARTLQPRITNPHTR